MGRPWGDPAKIAGTVRRTRDHTTLSVQCVARQARFLFIIPAIVVVVLIFFIDICSAVSQNSPRSGEDVGASSTENEKNHAVKSRLHPMHDISFEEAGNILLGEKKDGKRRKLNRSFLTASLLGGMNLSLKKPWTSGVDSEYCYWATSAGDGEHIAIGTTYRFGERGCPRDMTRVINVLTGAVIWEREIPYSGRYLGKINCLLPGSLYSIILGAHTGRASDDVGGAVVIIYDKDGRELIFLGEREWIRSGKDNDNTEQVMYWTFQSVRVSPNSRFAAIKGHYAAYPILAVADMVAPALRCIRFGNDPGFIGYKIMDNGSVSYLDLEDAKMDKKMIVQWEDMDSIESLKAVFHQ